MTFFFLKKKKKNLRTIKKREREREGGLIDLLMNVPNIRVCLLFFFTRKIFLFQKKIEREKMVDINFIMVPKLTWEKRTSPQGGFTTWASFNGKMLWWGGGSYNIIIIYIRFVTISFFLFLSHFLVYKKNEKGRWSRCEYVRRNLYYYLCCFELNLRGAFFLL